MMAPLWFFSLVLLLWLLLRWAKGAGEAPEENRTAPTQLPLPENRQTVLPTPWDLLGGAVSESAGQHQAHPQPLSSASPLETPSE